MRTTHPPMAPDPEISHAALFQQLVLGLLQSGMMQLGKIMNPISKKVEKDLEGVKATIDMLTMLRDKTKGNLGKPEAELIAGAISALQLNFVEEIGQAQQPASGAAPAEPPPQKS